VSPNAALVSERIATLARLLEKARGPRIVLTTVNALVQRVPPRSAFTNASLELRTNGTVQPEQLARFLEANGYGRAGTVTAFDLKTLKPKAEIKTGENPDAIIYDHYSKKVMVMNGGSKDLMVIDPDGHVEGRLDGHLWRRLDHRVGRHAEIQGGELCV
jgi:hypothetical protein